MLLKWHPFSMDVMTPVLAINVAEGLDADWVGARFQAYAKSIFSSWGQTKVVEDGFQTLRAKETRSTMSGELSTSSYWKALIGSGRMRHPH